MARNFLPWQKVDKENCKELLNRASSEFLRNEENPAVSVNKDAEFTRVWWFGVHDDAFQCRYFLDWWTDAKNTTRQFWVDDPIVGEAIIPGRWRQAFTRLIEDRSPDGEPIFGVAQTMRQGWATTLDFTESRINRALDLPGNSSGSGNEASDDPERWIFIDFPNFAPASVHSALESLTDSYTDVTVEGTNYGNFHRVSAEQVRQTDGSSIITLKLARPQYTLLAYSNWGGLGQADVKYLWNVPKDIAQTIIDANKSTGYTCRPTYRGELVDIVFVANTMSVLDLTWKSLDAELQYQYTRLYHNSYNAIEAPDGPQASIYRASNSFSQGGGYDGRLTYDVSRDKSVEFNSATSAFRTSRSWLYRNSRVVLTAPDVGGSGSYSVSQRENTDGTYDGQMVYVYGTGSGAYRYASLTSVLVDGFETIYKSSNDPIVAPADSQGIIYQASNQITEDGLYNANLSERTSNPTITGFGNLKTAFKTGTALLYRNSRTVIDTPSVTGSGIYRVSQNQNQDGTYDGVLQYVKGDTTGVYEFNSLDSHLLYDITGIYKSQSTPISAKTASRGYIGRASNQITEEGLYNSQSIYQASNPDNISVSWTTRYGTAETSLYKNQKIFPNLSTLNALYNNSVSPSINLDGSYDVTVTKVPYPSTQDIWGGGEHYIATKNDSGDLNLVYFKTTRSANKVEDWLHYAWDRWNRRWVSASFSFGQDRGIGVYVTTK